MSMWASLEHQSQLQRQQQSLPGSPNLSKRPSTSAASPGGPPVLIPPATTGAASDASPLPLTPSTSSHHERRSASASGALPKPGPASSEATAVAGKSISLRPSFGSVRSAVSNSPSYNVIDDYVGDEEEDGFAAAAPDDRAKIVDTETAAGTDPRRVSSDLDDMSSYGTATLGRRSDSGGEVPTFEPFTPVFEDMKVNDESVDAEDHARAAMLASTYDQLHVDHTLLLSYALDLVSMVDDIKGASNISSQTTFSDPSSFAANKLFPTDTTTLVSSMGRCVATLKAEFTKTQTLEKRVKDTERRLRARDEYLQNTIMDTAKRVQELERTIADLTNSNEELQLELLKARREREVLEEELEDLEEDHYTLQNEIIVNTDVVSTPALASSGVLLPTPHSAHPLNKVSDDILLMFQEITQNDPLLDDYVLLRDIETQTELPEPEPIPIPTQALRAAISGMPLRSSPPPPPISTSAATTTDRRHGLELLSLTSRLSYASLIAATQSETITALEHRVHLLDSECDRLRSSSADLAVRGEHWAALAEARERVVEELRARVGALERERMAGAMRGRVGSNEEMNGVFEYVAGNAGAAGTAAECAVATEAGWCDGEPGGQGERWEYGELGRVDAQAVARERNTRICANAGGC
ncbi:hypothetical protein HK101_003261 [Irineochytrium annulatum]|nr:hypothetical protein HK101_003261 [Irineochytrium annulatum]